MTDTEFSVRDNAQAALDKLRDDETETVRDLERLEVRLEVIRETIGLLAGRSASAPRKPKGRKPAVPVEPLPTAPPEMETL